MPTFDIKSCKKCAFCKYWFDPTLSAIKPENPKINLWSYDSKQKRICAKKNFEMHADATCNLFESKLREYLRLFQVLCKLKKTDIRFVDSY